MRASPTRRAALAGLGATALVAGPARAAVPLAGAVRQGGCLIGRGPARASINLDGKAMGASSAHGLFVVGFDRDAAAQASLAVGGGAAQALAVAPVAYDVQRIDGLPQDQVAPSDPALLARIRRELERKSAALQSRDDAEGFADGFDWPVAGAIRTSKFGPQRILNGVPKRPHYGVDLAAPQGTPIHAPAPGLVVFADPAMHFEGGLTLIDHGQGLISMYLHQSAQGVRAGDRVVRGQEIGRVGMTGRATGPHLCWRMSWRERHLDPSLLVGVSAPA